MTYIKLSAKLVEEAAAKEIERVESWRSERRKAHIENLMEYDSGIWPFRKKKKRSFEDASAEYFASDADLFGETSLATMIESYWDTSDHAKEIMLAARTARLNGDGFVWLTPKDCYNINLPKEDEHDKK